MNTVSTLAVLHRLIGAAVVNGGMLSPRTKARAVPIFGDFPHRTGRTAKVTRGTQSQYGGFSEKDALPWP